MPAPLGELTPERFLRDYWQKAPCLIRQAIPGFEPPLDGDDIAGLACEELADSRLVSGRYPGREWRVEYGPFDEGRFANLPDSNWTLLVQDVEKHYPPLQELLAMFDFLPSWRRDDLMVSYAVRGGSVGPHADQYDVFLFQASGDRLWQIAATFDPGLLPGCELNVLEHFEPQQEWILRPGDMLYLPPNVAHHGIALGEGMTWSIGLRAPSAADLAAALGEHLAERPGGGPRYADPDLAAGGRPGEIDAPAIGRLRELVQAAAGDGDFADFAAGFITRFRLAHEPAAPGPVLDARGLTQRLQQGARLVRNPWTRFAWVERESGARLFAAGAAVDCSIAAAIELCRSPEPEILSHAMEPTDLAAILALVNGGHLLLSWD